MHTRFILMLLEIGGPYMPTEGLFYTLRYIGLLPMAGKVYYPEYTRAVFEE